ncbi:MAG: aldose 1-epimerase [Polaribacter sp.]
MFKINELKENDFTIVELSNASKTSIAKICLNEGARVVNLDLNAKNIIEEQAHFKYKDSYASAILFPFAGRLENGVYSFKAKEYQLNCNHKNNAIHGLVYNKNFQITSVNEQQDYCAITLEYLETSPNSGFPFTFLIAITYTLYAKKLITTVKVTNTDTKEFPFGLGWHPYFKLEDIENTTLRLNSLKKAVVNSDMIPTQLEETIIRKPISLKETLLDDCFLVKENNVTLEMSTHLLQIITDKAPYYFQVFTPNNLPLVAIEPLTGLPDNFNNLEGLRVLNSKESYTQNWTVFLQD